MLDFVAAIVMSLGLALFILADSQVRYAIALIRVAFHLELTNLPKSYIIYPLIFHLVTGVS